jgi:hypothetical protein
LSESTVSKMPRAFPVRAWYVKFSRCLAETWVTSSKWYEREEAQYADPVYGQVVEERAETCSFRPVQKRRYTKPFATQHRLCTLGFSTVSLNACLCIAWSIVYLCIAFRQDMSCFTICFCACSLLLAHPCLLASGSQAWLRLADTFRNHYLVADTNFVDFPYAAWIIGY